MHWSDSKSGPHPPAPSFWTATKRESKEIGLGRFVFEVRGELSGGDTDDLGGNIFGQRSEKRPDVGFNFRESRQNLVVLSGAEADGVRVRFGPGSMSRGALNAAEDVD